jgi:hypothetical protein
MPQFLVRFLFALVLLGLGSAHEDSEQDLVDFQVEEAIADSLDRRRRKFTAWLTDWGMSYAVRVRDDHALFVDAFRDGAIRVSAT